MWLNRKGIQRVKYGLDFVPTGFSLLFTLISLAVVKNGTHLEKAQGPSLHSVNIYRRMQRSRECSANHIFTYNCEKICIFENVVHSRKHTKHRYFSLDRG